MSVMKRSERHFARNTTIRGGRSGWGSSQSHVVATKPPDLRSSDRFTVVDGRSPSLSSHDVPAGLRMVRALDRAVLEAAPRRGLRAVELYAPFLLRSRGPLETTPPAGPPAPPPSPGKQISPPPCARGP